ncbi:MAG TPA: SDR family oxidoreductase [Pyrinomonadaceae bacterium]|nr:SDR family oxidoreductase [Pyrinomonadaceae bacterium]
MDLEKKVAIVTGGTKGIGRAIAEALVSRGASVCISARSRSEIDETVGGLRSLGVGSATGIVADVCNYSQVKAMFELANTQLGGLDILVNSAGIGLFQTVEEMSPEDFRSVLETNLFGVYYCCHEAIPMMKKRGGGYIINLSSLAGVNAHPKMAAYNASKFGLNGFSEALMQEVRHDGIKVSYLMPGSVNTEFGGDEPGEEKSWQLQPSDIADVVIDLLQQDPRCLTSRVEIRPSKPPRK